MKKRAFFIILLFIGIALICVSIVSAIVKTAQTDIIGGADMPTFIFVVSDKSNILYTALSIIGLFTIITAIVMLVIKKK